LRRDAVSAQALSLHTSIGRGHLGRRRLDMKTLLFSALIGLSLAVSAVGCGAPGGAEEGVDESGEAETVDSTEEAITACVDTTEYEYKMKDCPAPTPDVECSRPCVTERDLVILPPTPGGPIAECRVVTPRHCYPWICPLCL
jgi:hypothetical protein